MSIHPFIHGSNKYLLVHIVSVTACLLSDPFTTLLLRTVLPVYLCQLSFSWDGQGEALARDRRLRSKEKPDYFFHPPLCFEHHFLQWFQLPIRQPLHPESLAVPAIVQPQPLILMTPSLPCVLRTLVVVAASCCH